MPHDEKIENNQVSEVDFLSVSLILNSFKNVLVEKTKYFRKSSFLVLRVTALFLSMIPILKM